MSCCGRRRAEAALHTHTEIRPAPMPASAHAADAAPDSERLRCIPGRSLLVRGPRSGRAYRFTEDESIPVDARDLEALLRTGLLRRD
jgi:hypothetical protein